MYAILFLIILVLVIFVVPARVIVRLKSIAQQPVILEAEYGFLCGLLRFSFSRALKGGLLRGEGPEEKRDAAESGWGEFLWRERQTCFWEAKLFFSTLFWKRIKGDLHFGFEDPSTTGEVFGYWMAISACAAIKEEEMILRPDFLDRRFEGQVSFRVFLSLLWTFVVIAKGVVHLWKKRQFHVSVEKRRRMAYD